MKSPIIATLGGGVLLLVWACGAPTCPAASSSPPPGPAATPLGGETTGRVVNALALESGIAQASIAGDNLVLTSTDLAGFFRLISQAPGTHQVRITSPSWVERQTMMKVPGAHADVSMIPGSFDMQFYQEMCRGFSGRSLRWTEPPALVVETSVIEYVAGLATGEQVPTALVDQTVDKLRRAMPLLSADRFVDFASVERRTTPAGAPLMLPTGAIVLTWNHGLLTAFGHVGFGSRSTRTTANLAAGEIALDSDWHIRHLPTGSRTDYDLVLQHEFGHTLGYSHTTVRPSFMYEGFLMDVSPKDREAFTLFFQRPSGNMSPDVDPSSTSLNISRMYSALVPIR